MNSEQQTQKPEMKKLEPAERSRTYHFPGRSISYVNVVAVCVRESGSHRLEMADGKKAIVNPGWLAIDLDVDAWTF